MPLAIDITGQSFGRLLVLSKSTERWFGHALWLCQCSCGNQHTAAGSDLRRLFVTSCGCAKIERMAVIGRRNATHGHARINAKSPTYTCWRAMHQRCVGSQGIDHKSRKYYHDLGISVCERWSSFELFLGDMGERPSLLHSIDRWPDKEGNYEPDNCRWATSKEQANNRKPRRTL